MRNLIERLECAVVCLAGPGTIKERLVDAYEHCLADLAEDDFPADMRASFAPRTPRTSTIRPCRRCASWAARSRNAAAAGMK